MITYLWPPVPVSVTVPPIAYTSGGVNTPVTPEAPLPVVNTLSVKEWATLDTATTNITNSAWVEITTTSYDIKKFQIFAPFATPIEVSIENPAVFSIALIFPGGCDLDLSIPSGTKVSLRSLGSTISDGEILINFLG